MFTQIFHLFLNLQQVTLVSRHYCIIFSWNINGYILLGLLAPLTPLASSSLIAPIPDIAEDNKKVFKPIDTLPEEKNTNKST